MKLMTSDPLRSTATRRSAGLADAAFERLKNAILSGEIPEGSRVREARLAKEWEIGITPLREAVRRMAALGYLVLEPNHAPVVRRLSPDDINQIYELREVLECFALKKAWYRISEKSLEKLELLAAKVENAKTTNARLRAQFLFDEQLHDLWTSQDANPWLNETLDRLVVYRPNLIAVLSKHQDFSEKAYREHLGILAALRRSTLDRALQLLGLHIRESMATLMSLTQER